MTYDLFSLFHIFFYIIIVQGWKFERVIVIHRFTFKFICVCLHFGVQLKESIVLCCWVDFN